jgi:hypothetical protein
LGGRGYPAQVLVVAVGVWHYLKRPLRTWQLLALALVAGYMLSSFQEVRRTTFSGELDLAAARVEGGLAGAVFTNNESIDRTVVVVAGVPNEIPYQYFGTYARLASTLIPRAIWPTKPALSEASVYASLFSPNTDPGDRGMYPGGPIGDFYLQLGLLGVLVGMFVSGCWQRAIYEWSRICQHPLALMIYLAALTSGVMFLRNVAIFQFGGRTLLICSVWLVLRQHRSTRTQGLAAGTSAA